MESKKNVLKSRIMQFLVIIILVFLGTLSIFQIIRVNTQYPQTLVVSTKLGDTLELDNLNIQGISFEMVPYKDINSDKKLKSVISQIEDGEVNLIKTTITINNDSKEIIEFPLYDVILQSYSWANAINLDTFKYFNDDRSLLITIKPNESVELVLPYLIHQIQFSDEDWKNANKRKFDLVFSLYPQKKVISLNRS